MRNHKTEMSLLVTPEMSNFGGKMHGGDLLKLLDQVAYTCAKRYCGNYVVTLPSIMSYLNNPLLSANYFHYAQRLTTQDAHR